MLSKLFIERCPFTRQLQPIRLIYWRVNGIYPQSKIESQFSRRLLNAFQITSIYAFFYLYKLTGSCQHEISNAGPKRSQQLIQAALYAMALSVEALVTIVGVVVALPSAILILWNLIKRINNRALRRRGMAVFFFFLRQVEEEMLSN